MVTSSMFRTLAFAAETFLFAYIGLSAVTVDYSNSIGLALWGLLLVMVNPPLHAFRVSSPPLSAEPSFTSTLCACMPSRDALTMHYTHRRVSAARFSPRALRDIAPSSAAAGEKTDESLPRP